MSAGEASPSELIVHDRGAWRAWLAKHHGDPTGVWLALAKKGTTEPTSLTYDDALLEALCYGWIDGQLRRGDERVYYQRFTPRRPKSRWSIRNTRLVDELTAQRLMHAAGIAAVQRAKTDGSWDSAYEGQQSVAVPEDFSAALRASRSASAAFGRLTSQNRYALLYRLGTLKSERARHLRIAQYIAMLEQGQTIHRQRTPLR